MKTEGAIRMDRFSAFSDRKYISLELNKLCKLGWTWMHIALQPSTFLLDRRKHACIVSSRADK
jgi:hypothetical protein